ncbi:PREDICTED: uncharacterized protein LOC109186512 [Ipomoea nil]|uniref:uncharacterized protein LOC109186512 n=1 Tax=Ipomoea nil TaxID=35883 RepID=UPI000901C62E|nr:PREDICTED: uncharacterized protein LOC109186512 [Ipomoea nil]
MKMGGKLSILLLLPIFFFFFTTSTASRDISELPHFNSSFTAKANQQIALNRCSYTVDIRTSCSSVRYTRDKISLSFGDAYGNEVYVARLDDPDSDTFERCSRDRFKIKGPCMDDVCYLYLYRMGSDGWKPQKVTVYMSAYRYVTFIYNRFIPRGVWYGFNHCDNAATAA